MPQQGIVATHTIVTSSLVPRRRNRQSRNSRHYNLLAAGVEQRLDYGALCSEKMYCRRTDETSGVADMKGKSIQFVAVVLLTGLFADGAVADHCHASRVSLLGLPQRVAWGMPLPPQYTGGSRLLPERSLDSAVAWAHRAALPARQSANPPARFARVPAPAMRYASYGSVNLPTVLPASLHTQRQAAVAAEVSDESLTAPGWSPAQVDPLPDWLDTSSSETAHQSADNRTW